MKDRPSSASQVLGFEACLFLALQNQGPDKPAARAPKGPWPWHMSPLGPARAKLGELSKLALGQSVPLTMGVFLARLPFLLAPALVVLWLPLFSCQAKPLRKPRVCRNGESITFPNRISPKQG